MSWPVCRIQIFPLTFFWVVGVPNMLLVHHSLGNCYNLTLILTLGKRGHGFSQRTLADFVPRTSLTIYEALSKQTRWWIPQLYQSLKGNQQTMKLFCFFVVWALQRSLAGSWHGLKLYMFQQSSIQYECMKIWISLLDLGYVAIVVSMTNVESV